MKRNNISIIAILSIMAIVSVGVFSVTTQIDDNLKPTEDDSVINKVMIHSLYAEEETPLDVQKEKADAIVLGKIVSIKQSLTYYDENGTEVTSDSSDIVITEPYIVYTIKVKETIRSNMGDIPTKLQFKVIGGVYDGIRYVSDVSEHSVGEEVIVVLKNTTGDVMELSAGTFSLYTIDRDENAHGAKPNKTKDSLKDQLREREN